MVISLKESLSLALAVELGGWKPKKNQPIDTPLIFFPQSPHFRFLPSSDQPSSRPNNHCQQPKFRLTLFWQPKLRSTCPTTIDCCLCSKSSSFGLISEKNSIINFPMAATCRLSQQEWSPLTITFLQSCSILKDFS